MRGAGFVELPLMSPSPVFKPRARLHATGSLHLRVASPGRPYPGIVTTPRAYSGGPVPDPFADIRKQLALLTKYQRDMLAGAVKPHLATQHAQIAQVMRVAGYPALAAAHWNEAHRTAVRAIGTPRGMQDLLTGIRAAQGVQGLAEAAGVSPAIVDEATAALADLDDDPTATLDDIDVSELLGEFADFPEAGGTLTARIRDGLAEQGVDAPGAAAGATACVIVYLIVFGLLVATGPVGAVAGAAGLSAPLAAKYAWKVMAAVWRLDDGPEPDDPRDNPDGPAGR